ncbi:hypothetical protein [Vibrio cortegadensis]|uniref:hypothetical protein n=1 Tax=Vibrio cortegadensis TaxID=1328770 RepID=UPI00352C7270
MLLSELGSFGSFLSGLGTILAAAVAAYGVDKWVHQLKQGRLLSVIWGTKVQVKKLESSLIDWEALNFYRPNEDFEKENKVISDITNLTDELEKSSWEIDVLDKTNHKQFSSLVMDLRLAFKARNDHINTYEQVTDKLSSEPLIEFEKARESLKDKQCSVLALINSTLEKLEISYS